MRFISWLLSLSCTLTLTISIFIYLREEVDSTDVSFTVPREYGTTADELSDSGKKVEHHNLHGYVTLEMGENVGL